MSSLYNKGYITASVDRKVNKILTEGGSFDIDVDDLSNREAYVVVQHCLIKYIEQHGKTDNVDKMLKKFYDDFITHPHLFLDSPLVKDGFLDRFMPKEFREKAKKFRSEYYNVNSCSKIYEKLMKNYSLSDKEKNRLYAYLIKQIESGNPNYNNAINNCINKILSSNKTIKELNDMELKFYCKFIAQKEGEYNEVYPDVHIVSRKPTNGGFEMAGSIFINKDTEYTKSLALVTQTVCHETRHAIQEKLSKEKINKVSFEYARHELFVKYLMTEDYDVYHKNYRYSGIELDAEETGYANAAALLSSFGRNDMAEEVRNQRREKFDRRHFYEYMLGKDKHMINADDFIVGYLDEIIKNNPEEVKNYKALTAIYNEEGKRKPFTRIIGNLMFQGIDDRGLYDNYVNYGIVRDELDRLDLQRAGKENCRKLFDSLSYIYQTKSYMFNEYCNDTNYSKNNLDIHVEKSTSYELDLLNKIISYVDKNMDIVLDSNDEDKLSSSGFIHRFIYYFRDFDASKIKNEAIKNSPEIQERLNKLLSSTDSVIRKFNRQYIKDRIKDLSSEQLNTTIKTPDGVNMTLNEYLFYDLLPRIDGHTTIEVDGRKLYVDKIIKNCIDEVNKVNISGNTK